MFIVKIGTPDHGRGRPSKYPFGSMTVGTYFEIPPNHPGAMKRRYGATVRATAQSAAYSYGRLNNMKFSTKIMESGAVRIYRVG